MARTVDPERAAARRAAITHAAGELFARQGFERTSAADIARAVGMSSGSVFYYFPDKRAVFRSVFEQDLPKTRELIDRCASIADPLTAILEIVEALAEETLYPHASGLVVELLRQSSRDPELISVLTENATIVHVGLAAHIERGKHAGTIDPELDAQDAAAWIQSMIDGAFLNASPEHDPRPMLRRTVSRFLVPGDTA